MPELGLSELKAISSVFSGKHRSVFYRFRLGSADFLWLKPHVRLRLLKGYSGENANGQRGQHVPASTDSCVNRTFPAHARLC